MTCPEKKFDNGTVREFDCIDPEFRDKSSMVPGQSSYISDFKLVCGLLGKIPDFMLSIMFAGVMCATPFNYLADAFGRKTMMAIACLLQGVAVFAIALSQNEALYGAGLFFSGFMGGLKYKAAAVLIIESVTSPYRAHAGTALLIAFSSGYVLLAFLAQLIPQWRSMLYVISGLSVVSAAIIQFFVLESTGWLARTKKYEKMEYNTSKLVTNEADRDVINKDFRDGKIGDDEEDERDQATGVAGFLHQVMTLFKNKILLPRLFVGFIFWFCTSILFRVFALNTSSLSGSPYNNMIFSALGDIAASALSLLIIKLMGRREAMTICFGFFGICTFICFLFVENDNVVRWVCIISKLGIMGACNIGYIYTPELFPTMQRTTAMGVIGFIEGIGAVVSPQFKAIYTISKSTFFIAQTVMSAISAVLIFLILPETSSFGLPKDNYDLAMQDTTRRIGRLDEAYVTAKYLDAEKVEEKTGLKSDN